MHVCGADVRALRFPDRSPARNGATALSSLGRPHTKCGAGDALDVLRLHRVVVFAPNLDVDVRTALAVP
ncbi:hypothetical protein AB0I77_53740, partial [Streptomyces sp. NPDC050619]|uniref:hypothetical protein n=1 Tax=Streptomyces sp. NPDC050619 TaxID=3157214 RepID=UPI003447C4CC